MITIKKSSINKMLDEREKTSYGENTTITMTEVIGAIKSLELPDQRMSREAEIKMLAEQFGNYLFEKDKNFNFKEFIKNFN